MSDGKSYSRPRRGTAANILERIDRTLHSKEQIKHIAGVLKRLGHDRAARTLISRNIFG